MKVLRATLCSALAACLSISGSHGAAGDETAAATDSKGRSVYQDERPDDSRGWMIVTKASYWPLCYESLDRLEETRQLIGNAKPEELASSFEKCGAWLALAGSAAMTDGRSGVGDVGGLCSDAADSIRAGTGDWTDAQLADLVVLGHLGMAKSHVLRANEADERGNLERLSANVSENQTTELRQAAKEIAQLKVQRDIEQYKHDTRQSLQHLGVAQAYLQAAVDAGGLEVDEAVLEEVSGFPAEGKPHELVDFVDGTVRPRTKAMLSAVDAKRKEVSARIGER